MLSDEPVMLVDENLCGFAGTMENVLHGRINRDPMDASGLS